MKTYTVISMLFLVLLAGSSCKKNDGGNGTKAVFSYVVDGFQASFTNFSTNAKEYSWDFGDGSDPATARNPSHIYHQKGPFLVSLTVKNGAESNTFVDTVTIIGPNIKIDGEFADWEHVEYTKENDDGTGGTIKAVKTFASAENVFFYVEGVEDMDFGMFTLYINKDNNPATGFSVWFYPAGSGAEFLCQGTYNMDNPNLSIGSIYAHQGTDPAAWSWSEVAKFENAMKFSRRIITDDVAAIEFSIQRSALGNPTGQLSFALMDDNPITYASDGSVPVSHLPTSQFLTIKL
ncbi:MAG: PKD domain-containing protein [Chitinophagaceae bacterium]|nr:PKD domain-containing protein [Chitinophagaceae bacterium]